VIKKILHKLSLRRRRNIINQMVVSKQQAEAGKERARERERRRRKGERHATSPYFAK
jgi:hypothetical protein